MKNDLQGLYFLSEIILVTLLTASATYLIGLAALLIATRRLT